MFLLHPNVHKFPQIEGRYDHTFPQFEGEYEHTHPLFGGRFEHSTFTAKLNSVSR